MNARSGTIAAVVAILVVGFAIGGWLAFVTRASNSNSNATRVTLARTTRTAEPLRTGTPAATARAIATPIGTATPVPAAKPAPTVASVSTAVPIATTRAAALTAVPQGSWELDEANTQVGTIVWAAPAVLVHGDTTVLDAHKQSVGGRAAVPCERQTTLHAEFAAGAAEQSVPYREVNCEGTVSTGELHVSYPRIGGSFSGSFWRNGVKLGDLTAYKR